MFSLKNVTKRYGTLMVLDDFSLTIDQGSTVSLIGPSGCGKSTILKLMLGLEEADSGQISFRDSEVKPDSSGGLRRRIGYVIQHGGLFPHLSAKENILLMSRFLKQSPKDAQDRLMDLAALTHLDAALLDKFPSQLSGGQKQRVALMRALMLDPEVLLLDEPLGALDTLVRFDLQQELKSLFDSLGKTVVIVTHDMGEAAYLADRIVLMNEGRIEQDGIPSDFLTNPATDFAAAFMTAQRTLTEGVGA